MAHEKSITVEIDDRFVNLPTVIEGREVADDEAVRLFQRGQLQSLGEFKTLDEAVSAAEQRSAETPVLDWTKMPKLEMQTPEAPSGIWSDMPTLDPGTPEKLRAAGEQAVFGVERSGAIATGAGLGMLLGAPAGPPGMAVGGTLGAYAGKVLGEWVTRGKREIDDYPPSLRPYAVGGMIAGESIPFAALPGAVAQTGARLPDAEFGWFINRVLDTAARHPKTTMISEVSGVTGASFAGGAAEAYAPGRLEVRIPAEIVGGFFSPTRLAGSAFKGTVESLRFTKNVFLSEAGRQNEAARILQKLIIEADEDPIALAAKLRSAGYTDAKVTSAMLSGSPALAAMEKTLSRVSGRFGAEQKKLFDESIFSMKAAMLALRETGDPVALKEYAKIRQQYFKTLVAGRIQMAEREATDAASRITTESPRDRMALSKHADDILTRTMKDVREIEKELWGRIQKDRSADGKILQATAERLRSEMLPNEVFPPPMQGFLDEIGERGGRWPTTVGELITFRSRALALTREYQANGQYTWAWLTGNLAEAALDDLSKNKWIEAAYDEARTFSREMNDVFTRTFAGDAMARVRSGGDKIPPELLLEKALAGGATQSAIRLQQLRQSVDFLAQKAPENLAAVDNLRMMNDVQERMLRLVASESIDPSTGRVNPGRLRRWLIKNEAMLDNFPELKSDLTKAVTSEAKLQDVQRSMTFATRVIEQKAAFSRISNQHPVDAVRQALMGPKPMEDLTSLAKVAKRGGQAAKDGLLASVWEDAIRRHSPTGEFNAESFMRAMKDPVRPGQPSIIQIMINEGIMTKPQADHVDRLYGEIARIQRAFSEGRPIEELVSEMDPVFDLAVRIAGAGLGESMTRVGPGGGLGHGLIAAGRGSSFARHLFEKVPMTRVRDLLIEASLNPEFGAMLLEKPITPKTIIQASRQIHAYMIQAGLSLTDEDQTD